MRRFSRRSGGPRKKVNWVWEGTSQGTSLAALTTTAIALSTPSSRAALGLGHCTLTAIHLEWRFAPNAANAAVVQDIKMYVALFPTDVSQVVPSALITAPFTSDADALEKPYLWWGMDGMTWLAAGGTNPALAAGRHEVLRAKRRVGPEDELDWVVEARTASTFNYIARILWRDSAR